MIDTVSTRTLGSKKEKLLEQKCIRTEERLVDNNTYHTFSLQTNRGLEQVTCPMASLLVFRQPCFGTARMCSSDSGTVDNDGIGGCSCGLGQAEMGGGKGMVRIKEL